MVAKVGRTTLLDGVHQLRVSLQVKLVSNVLKPLWRYSIIRRTFIKGGTLVC
jgi:hypothetical protein